MADVNETKATTGNGQEPGRAAREYAARAAGTAVDVPIGAAVGVAVRAGELVEDGRSTARTELKRFGDQLRTELDQAERRGGTVRRDAVERARRARTRFSAT